MTEDNIINSDNILSIIKNKDVIKEIESGIICLHLIRYKFG
jgi:hypothetical protein